MNFIYNISIYAYTLAIRLAALLGNKKAALWVNGRKSVFTDIALWRANNEGKLYWFHCASLGEFEQGRSLMEALKEKEPATKILLTFFSPSGYEIRKKYAGADFICYLPADTVANAQKFVALVKPTTVFFVKYEYWANYFFALKKNAIPLYVISAILRPEQRFFGLMKSFWLQVLQCVTHFFVQNESTMHLLHAHGFSNSTLSGDTRFDRVATIKQQSQEIKELAEFTKDSFCIVGGSTWPQDEALLIRFLAENKALKMILVPHETDANHIAALQKKLPQARLWSELGHKGVDGTNSIIIDTIGMLASIYQYADVVLIGGGFGKGIHNTLEAAAWSKPIVHGPNYHKFEEAKGLIACGAAQSIADYVQLENVLTSLMNDEAKRTTMGNAAGDFVLKNIGATERIVRMVVV